MPGPLAMVIGVVILLWVSFGFGLGFLWNWLTGTTR